MAISVFGSVSKPPAGIDTPVDLRAAVRFAVDPLSTANAPLRLPLCPSRYDFSVDSSVASTVLVATSSIW